MQTAVPGSGELGDEGLLGVAEVARLAGVTPAAVANWRSRGTAGFPAPAHETKAGPLYRRSEIAAWLSQRSSGKPANAGPLGIERTLWAAADKLRGSVDASQYRHIVLGLLFLRRVLGSPEPLPGVAVANRIRWDESLALATEETLAGEVTRVLDELAKANPVLATALPDLNITSVDARRLLGLVRLIGELAAGADTRQRDVLGRSYEYFLGRFASLEGRSGGEFYTPSTVVRLLVEIVEPLSGIVYDPCCGSGGMFVQSARFLEAHGGQAKDLRIYGQELNPGTWRMARMNLALHDLAGDLGSKPADTFHEDQHPSLLAHAILANPPFNASDWGVEDLAKDPRWAFGVPPAGNANFAWIEHIVSHLAKQGRAGIVLSNGALTSDLPAEAGIRAALVDADLVECMVALPQQLFYSTGIPVTLWFLAKDKTAHSDRRGQVLFIDARELGEKASRTHRELRDEDIELIAGIYRSWRDTAVDPGMPELAATASIDDIRAQDYALAPPRYVKRAGGDDDGPQLADAAARYIAIAEEIAELDARVIVALRSLVKP